MNWCRREPTLKDILSDSIVRAVMEADGVDPHELEAMLKEVGRNVSPPHRVRLWAPRSASSHHATN
jgi:hypothetical protein